MMHTAGGVGSGGVPHQRSTPPQETHALPAGGPRYNVSRDGTLVIARPAPRDAGTYVCTATNSVGFSSQETRLSVNSEWSQARPRDPLPTGHLPGALMGPAPARSPKPRPRGAVPSSQDVL